MATHTVIKSTAIEPEHAVTYSAFSASSTTIGTTDQFTYYELQSLTVDADDGVVTLTGELKTQVTNANNSITISILRGTSTGTELDGSKTLPFFGGSTSIEATMSISSVDITEPGPSQTYTLAAKIGAGDIVASDRLLYAQVTKR